LEKQVAVEADGSGPLVALNDTGCEELANNAAAREDSPVRLHDKRDFLGSRRRERLGR
jgi:hypothetical protein